MDDPDLRQKLDHSKVTNLVGEQAFGDLDFSMFKRRNATAHYHSTVNILKRNKTLSDWFLSISPEQQAAALSRATAKHRELRKQRREAEQQALVRRREVLEEHRRKRAAREEQRRLQKTTVIERLKPHNGPCIDARDVRRLLKKYRKVGDRLFAVRAELQYHKLILGEKVSSSAHLQEAATAHHKLEGVSWRRTSV